MAANFRYVFIIASLNENFSPRRIGRYLTLSWKTGEGLSELFPYLTADSTVCLLGSSGVGKSSLVNRLLGESVMKVNQTREEDGRGRHTTTHRQMIVLANGVSLIDTPGMHELGMWDSNGSLDGPFPTSGSCWAMQALRLPASASQAAPFKPLSPQGSCRRSAGETISR